MNPSLLQPQNTAEELLLLMLQFQRKLIRPSEHLHRDSLSPIQFQALGTLSQFGPQSMSELAAVLMISKQQLTPVVDKLDRMGLVIRTGDALDRRVIRLGLSPGGYDFLNNIKIYFVELV